MGSSLGDADLLDGRAAARARLAVAIVGVEALLHRAGLPVGAAVVRDGGALRGDATQIKAVAREFKVFYEKVPGTAPDNYTGTITYVATVNGP